MQLRHAHTLAQARTYVAALADEASNDAASSAYEHVLIELDRLDCDQSPDVYLDALTQDRTIQFDLATAAIEDLKQHGRRSTQRRTRPLDAARRLQPGLRLMYGETGAAMRAAFAELLRQHRVQQRLGGTPTERADVGAQIRQYRQTVPVWCSQALESVSPLTFSNQTPTQPNPFRSVGTAGQTASPAGELNRAINLAKTKATATSASIEQLTTPTGHESVELWRTAARAAALAEHDTGPDVATAMSVPQAQAVVADVAAITQALVVLDQRYRNTPGWEQLAQAGRLGWAALAAALDVNLRQPDTIGWRPKTKLITGPAKPGILVVRMK